MRTLPAFCALWLALLCSCANEKAIRPTLPADVSINKGAGRGDELFATLHLESGENLVFIVDTGCLSTLLDSSLEPQLGKPVGKERIKNAFYPNTTGNIYNAHPLYLGNTRLLTGRYVTTMDIKRIIGYPGRPVRGVLGMDCLRHYCVQLDFANSKIHFLNPDNLQSKNLGNKFQLRSKDWGGLSAFIDVSFCGKER